MISSKFSTILRCLVCSLVTILIISWANGLTALSVQAMPQQTSPEPQEQLFHYLNTQKYTLLLGEDRQSCAYHIDATDLYEQENNRFMTAKISQGMGTGCRGIVQLAVLQADCQTNALYKFQRETEDGSSGWQRFEIRLSDRSQPQTSPSSSQQAVANLCALPARSVAE